MGKAQKKPIPPLTIVEAPLEQAPARPAKPRKKRPRRKRVPDNLTFAAALSAAEKRLPEAIREQAEAASRHALLGAEIAYLQATVIALRNQQRTAAYMPQYMGVPVAPPVLPARIVPMETIMSDQPIPPAAPPALVPVAAQALQQTSLQPQGPELPYIPGRAGGGALAMNVDPETDEEEHLKSSAVAGGQWV